MPAARELEIDGRKMHVTNLRKVLYPARGFTKAQVIDCYARVVEMQPPHFQESPVTLER